MKLYRKGTKELVFEAKKQGKSRRYIRILAKKNQLKLANVSLNSTQPK